jgi:hypothetical protein
VKDVPLVVALITNTEFGELGEFSIHGDYHYQTRWQCKWNSSGASQTDGSYITSYGSTGYPPIHIVAFLCLAFQCHECWQFSDITEDHLVN